MLEIVTGHKAFQIRSPISAEVDQWHLRLQEVIMLQEKEIVTLVGGMSSLAQIKQ